MPGPGELSEFEQVVGMVFGLEPDPTEVPPSRQELAEALGDMLEPHLASGRCLIWQTGDDGGALALAAAVRRARREGLPDPTPLTLVGKKGAPDDAYVRAVVDGLGLKEWTRVDAVGRLGLLGLDAREGLLRHGIRYPSIAHVVAPVAREAEGGTIVDCHGLREVWDFWRGAPVRRLLQARRPRRTQVARAAVALAPRPLRRRAIERAMASLQLDHLRPQVLAWLRERYVDETVTMPMTASGAALRLYQRRCLWETARTFTSVAADNGARLIHFYTDAGVAAALAGASGWWGWPTSAAMLAELFPEIPARPTRAPGTPSDPFWEGPETEAFVTDWDGTGIDETLVDPVRVREAWRQRETRAGMLLQSAWLASSDAAGERAGASTVPAAE